MHAASSRSNPADEGTRVAVRLGGDEHDREQHRRHEDEEQADPVDADVPRDASDLAHT